MNTKQITSRLEKTSNRPDGFYYLPDIKQLEYIVNLIKTEEPETVANIIIGIISDTYDDAVEGYDVTSMK